MLTVDEIKTFIDNDAASTMAVLKEGERNDYKRNYAKT